MAENGLQPVVQEYRRAFFDQLIEVAGLEPGGKTASTEDINSIFGEMRREATGSAFYLNGAEVPFDYAAQITKDSETTSSKFGFIKEEKKIKRTEYHPMRVIRDDVDYSGRRLERDGVEACIAINAAGLPVYLKKLKKMQSSPGGGPSAEYEYVGWESLAKPEDFFDTLNTSTEDLHEIWTQWCRDLTAAAARYYDLHRERKYSPESVVDVSENTAVHKKFKDEIMVGLVPAVIVGAVGVLGATFGVPERVSEFWGGRSATASAQSAEFGGQDISSLVATALQDECYKGPDITPPEHTEKSKLDGVVTVTSDTPEVRVMGASARVWVRQGVHVEKVLVCGASAVAQIDGTVVTAAVFGAESGIQVLNSASVRNAVADGSGAKIIVGPTGKVKNQIVNGEPAN